ncbi:MAG: NAD(P) transhydrogenase subunit alpha, partial [Maricaulis sp.]
MRIAILKERHAGETRVAATPDTVKKFVAAGHTVAIEKGAGLTASVTDDAYATAGAEMGTLAVVLKGADALFSVQMPDE